MIDLRFGKSRADPSAKALGREERNENLVSPFTEIFARFRTGTECGKSCEPKRSDGVHGKGKVFLGIMFA